MANDQRWRAALTRLSRLAQREPEARTWIEEMLERNLPGILGAAIEVAAETGPPLPELLTGVLERNASPQASEAVARSVPIDATALQDLAIAAIRSLLGRPGWLGEARAAAEQAVAEAQADLGEFASARARSVDAYDVIAQAQLASGDAEGAVRSARRALALRQELADPFRQRADGERRLGLALLRLGRADEACAVLTEAAAHARDLLEHNRDALIELNDRLAGAAAAAEPKPAPVPTSAASSTRPAGCSTRPGGEAIWRRPIGSPPRSAGWPRPGRMTGASSSPAACSPRSFCGRPSSTEDSAWPGICSARCVRRHAAPRTWAS